MGRTSKLKITESVQELRKSLKFQTKSYNISRVQALIHLKESTFISRISISDHLGISLRTLERWIGVYMKGGLEGLLQPKVRKRKSYLIPDEVDSALAKRVNDNKMGFSSYVEAQKWVASEFGLDFKYNTIREHLIRRYKTKIKSPRKSHVKKDDKAVGAFLKTA